MKHTREAFKWPGHEKGGKMVHALDGGFSCVWVGGWVACPGGSEAGLDLML